METERNLLFISLFFSLRLSLSKAELTCTSLPLGEKVVSEKEYCFCFWRRE